MDAAAERPPIDERLARMVAFVTPRSSGGGCFVGGVLPDEAGPLFGGFAIAHAVGAATRDLAPGRRMHSLHGFFMRPMLAELPIESSVRTVREGRSFGLRHVALSQRDKQVFDMTASFTSDDDDPENHRYDRPADEALTPPDEAAAQEGPGPWHSIPIGPSPLRDDGTRASTHRAWFRIPLPLADDVALHTALLAFATDWTETGGRPNQLEGDTTGMTSLDHSVWFHRPARADEWLHYDVESVVNAGGRGLLRGVIRSAAGDVVISVAQEMRLTPTVDRESG